MLSYETAAAGEVEGRCGMRKPGSYRVYSEPFVLIACASIVLLCIAMGLMKAPRVVSSLTSTFQATWLECGGLCHGLRAVPLLCCTGLSHRHEQENRTKSADPLPLS